jgi:membrane protein required for colicin V production
MAWIDWVIVIIMASAVIGGLSQGFFRSAFGLAGLLVGLATASWNYGRVAAIFLPLVRLHSVADVIGFLLIALLIMAVFAIIGAILARAFRLIGLGCLDSLAGAIFGFFQGVILVTLGILALAAFFPDTQWLEKARLPKLFFGACHLSTHISPAELAHRVRDGLKILEHDSRELINPKPVGS